MTVFIITHSLSLYSAVIVEDVGGEGASTAARCRADGLPGAAGRGGSVRQRRERDGGEIKAAREDRIHGSTRPSARRLITNQYP